MANHIAVLGMITAFGIPGPEATPLISATADAPPPRAFSKGQECAPTRGEATSTAASPDGPFASATVAQRAAGSDVPAARPPLGEIMSDGTYKQLNQKYFPFPLK
jgi:hypothetical protein